MFAVSSPSVLCSRPSRAASGRRNAVLVQANEKQGKGGEEGGKKFGNTAYGMIAKNANFAILSGALLKTKLDEALEGAGPFTVFAPNDDAFVATCKALKVSKLELLNMPNLADILKYHVVAGKIMSSDLTEGAEVVTLLGKTLKVSLKGGASINGVKVKKADVNVSNGVLHSMEGVLIPQ